MNNNLLAVSVYEATPILIVGAILGIISAVFIVAAVVVKDNKDKFVRSVKDGALLKRLWSYAAGNKWHFIVAGIFMIFSVMYDILSPLIVGRIESVISGKFQLSELWRYIILYGAMLIVSLISAYFQAIILQKTGQRIITRLRCDLFDHIEHLSHAQLNEIPVGKLVTRVSNDTEAISRLFTDIIIMLAKNSIIIAGVIIAMMLCNYTLTLMILCFAPFIVLFTLVFRKFSRRAHRSVKDGTTDINTFLSENLSGMQIIQIFNREERKMHQFTELNDKLDNAKLREIIVFAIFRPLVYMLYISSVLCLLYLCGTGAIGDIHFLGQRITGQTLVTFYMYTSTFFNPIQSLAEQFNWLQSAFASAEKVFAVLDTKPVIVDSPDAIELDKVRGDIEFKDVWFAYKPGEWVLKGVSFKIKAGENAAFVGATGSGKTTILALICRNYDVQKGEVLLDGINVKKIKLANLRSHFGQMMQDVFLFSGTIRSNIEMMSPPRNYTAEEACRYVNADRFIAKLPKGIDEPVRERGNNFSAGERQLLSFARTVYHQPEVLILDEATANIDTETEQLIQNSLEKMMNIGTMLVVAHRLSTVKKADKIIVLSRGKIIEEGTHAQLIKNHGRYFQLYTIQYGGEAPEGSPA